MTKRSILIGGVAASCILVGASLCEATNQVYGIVTSGFGASQSSSYASSGVVGQVGGESQSSHFRSYSGILALQTRVPVLEAPPASGFVFSDPSPTSDEIQNSTNITFRVTLNAAGNTIKSVSYGISHVAGVPPSTLRTDVFEDTVISTHVVRFKVVLPNAAGDTLQKNDNNYLYFFAKNDADADAYPAIYQVKVAANASGPIVITQPDDKGGVSGTLPQLAALIANPSAVDATSIQIRLDTASGTNLLLRTSAQDAAIYNAATGVVSYKYAGNPLTVNARYRLTISATYTGGSTETETLSFVVRDGAIADLIPYPSPCDPKIQPVTIRYVLNKRADVTVNIFDMGGRLVKNIISNDSREPGINEETWRAENYAGADLANGIYLCEVVARDSDGEHRRYTSLAIFGK